MNKKTIKKIDEMTELLKKEIDKWENIKGIEMSSEESKDIISEINNKIKILQIVFDQNISFEDLFGEE